MPITFDGQLKAALKWIVLTYQEGRGYNLKIFRVWAARISLPKTTEVRILTMFTLVKPYNRKKLLPTAAGKTDPISDKTVQRYTHDNNGE